MTEEFVEETTPRECTEIRIPVPWGHIAGKAWGSKNDQPVLMLHGLLDNAGSFDRLLRYLPKDFYYVAIDLPGHGLSSFFPSGLPLNFMNYVYSISYVLDFLKWDKCVCISHSLGSQLAVCYTVLYPGRLEKLVVIDSFIPVFTQLEHLVENTLQLCSDAVDAMNNDKYKTYTKEEVIYALTNMRSSTLNTAAANALFPRSVTKVGDNLYKYNRDQRVKKRLSPFMHIEDALKLFSRNTTPILAIFATESYMTIYEQQTQFIKSRKEIRYQLVQGNHDVHNNNPEVVAPHICNFLNTHILNSKL